MAWSEQDRADFAARLTMLAETLNEPMTAARIAGYVVALEDIEPECIVCGLEEAMRECKFFPKPVELRDLGQASKKWRRMQEAKWAQIAERRPRYLPRPELTPEQLADNIAKLKAAIGKLSHAKRMR